MGDKNDRGRYRVRDVLLAGRRPGLERAQQGCALVTGVSAYDCWMDTPDGMSAYSIYDCTHGNQNESILCDFQDKFGGGNDSACPLAFDSECNAWPVVTSNCDMWTVCGNGAFGETVTSHCAGGNGVNAASVCNNAKPPDGSACDGLSQDRADSILGPTCLPGISVVNIDACRNPLFSCGEPSECDGTQRQSDQGCPRLSAGGRYCDPQHGVSTTECVVALDTSEPPCSSGDINTLKASDFDNAMIALNALLGTPDEG